MRPGSGARRVIRRNGSDGGAYRGFRTFLTPLETVARVERLLPSEWLAPEGNDVTAAFRDYAAPLIGEVQSYGAMF